MSGVLIAIGIHLVVPLAGIAWYVALCLQLSRQGAPGALLVSFFGIFACYGAALVLILTALFWHWSGMASIGAAALLLFAPLPMLAQGIGLWFLRRRSKYHAAACWLSLAYFAIVLIAFAVIRFGGHGKVLAQN